MILHLFQPLSLLLYLFPLFLYLSSYLLLKILVFFCMASIFFLPLSLTLSSELFNGSGIGHGSR
jgi:hypothetical protein